MYETMRMAKMKARHQDKTLAIGRNKIANVNVSFVLE
jgi:hypothetical protein